METYFQDLTEYITRIFTQIPSFLHFYIHFVGGPRRPLEISQAQSPSSTPTWRKFGHFPMAMASRHFYGISLHEETPLGKTLDYSLVIPQIDRNGIFQDATEL